MGETNVMILKKLLPVQLTIDQKKNGEGGIFQLFGQPDNK